LSCSRQLPSFLAQTPAPFAGEKYLISPREAWLPWQRPRCYKTQLHGLTHYQPKHQHDDALTSLVHLSAPEPHNRRRSRSRSGHKNESRLTMQCHSLCTSTLACFAWPGNPEASPGSPSQRHTQERCKSETTKACQHNRSSRIGSASENLGYGPLQYLRGGTQPGLSFTGLKLDLICANASLENVSSPFYKDSIWLQWFSLLKANRSSVMRSGMEDLLTEFCPARMLPEPTQEQPAKGKDYDFK
jgi:hypothetical protein